LPGRRRFDLSIRCASSDPQHCFVASDGVEAAMPYGVVVALVATTCVLSAAIGLPALAEDYEQINKRCYESDKPDQTIEACSTVIASGRVDSEDLATAFKNRGNAYDDKGQYDLAIQDYDHAIATNPNDADAFNNRGTSYRARGQYDLAIQDYDQAIRLIPNNAKALNNRCFAKALAGQLEQGLADCNESIRLRPRNANTLASRGFIYLKLKRYDAAIADYDAEWRISPGNPYSLFGRGMAKRMKGNLSGGDADIAAAKAIKADIADKMAKLGVHL
jgi:tetratricopeptide (TPR) repeat protein